MQNITQSVKGVCLRYWEPNIGCFIYTGVMPELFTEDDVLITAQDFHDFNIMRLCLVHEDY